MSKTPRVLVINLNQERLDALNWATCAQASKKTTGNFQKDAHYQLKTLQ